MSDQERARLGPAFQYPLDPSTWKLSVSPTIGRVPMNADGSIPIIPTFSVNPSTSPIGAGTIGSVTVRDKSVATQQLAVDANGQIGINALPPAYVPSFASATFNGTTAVQLVPARGAGVKTVIYQLSLLNPTNTSGTAATLTVGDNSATYNNIIPGYYSAAAAHTTVYTLSLPNGVQQPTANSAIYILGSAADAVDQAWVWYA